jgi:ATP-binding cassette, subfamily B, bacterial PglK
VQSFKKILSLLSPHERKRVFFLLIMIIIMALLDMIGVAFILPFMTVLANPSLIETNSILNTMFKISNIFGVENNQQFFFFLAGFLFVLTVSSLAFKTLATYVQVQFVHMCEHSISKRLVEGYLHQPYSWFLSRNSADLGKNILSEVTQVVGNGLKPLMELIAKSMVVISLIILLLIVDLKLTLIVGGLLSVVYLLIFYFVRNYLDRNGQERLINNQLRYMAVNEGFGATKEIKVGGLEKTYINIFSKASLVFARTQTSSIVIAQLPRFILEAIAIGGVLLIMLYSISQTGTFNNALPVVSLYVYAGYRLIPALQSIYTSFTQLTFVSPSLNKLHKELINFKPLNENQDEAVLTFNKTITLKNIYYNYSDLSGPTLKDISLTIPTKSIVGIVGATGSGKTTMVDVIIGLLECQKGTLEVDGKVITKKNLRSWQRCIGYVPQHIYLSDNTLSANIAFGVEAKDINQDMVEKVAKISNLHEFVTEELPKQYQTTIGERGVRLSGGQRQRVGIARALYQNPKVLILDEATSALDNQTEKVVMNAVNNLSKDITIIIIAHRLDTIKKCDKIFLLEKGQLKNEGTFKELINNNKNFSVNAINDN